VPETGPIDSLCRVRVDLSGLKKCNISRNMVRRLPDSNNSTGVYHCASDRQMSEPAREYSRVCFTETSPGCVNGHPRRCQPCRKPGSDQPSDSRQRRQAALCQTLADTLIWPWLASPVVDGVSPVKSNYMRLAGGADTPDRGLPEMAVLRGRPRPIESILVGVEGKAKTTGR
jgi:hypothetical protein